VNLLSTNGVTLATNQTFVYYSNYVSKPDAIAFSLSDGRGGIANGMVIVLASPAGRFTAAGSGTSSNVTLHIAGRPGTGYYVQRSTNLVHWHTIATNVAPASGLFDYIDPFTGMQLPVSPAYYRLGWQP
jgi:hypothetical protein